MFKSLGKLTSAQFSKLKGDVSDEVKSLGKMPEQVFQKLKEGLVLANQPQKLSKQLLNAEISAYTASRGETDDRPRETSTGTRAREGIVASNDTKLYGKKVKIDGKVYTVEDTMNKRYRNEFEKTGKLIFDILMEDKKKGLEFGRQNKFIEILDR